MPGILIRIAAAVLVGGAASVTAIWFADDRTLPSTLLRRYTSWWRKTATLCGLDKNLDRVPIAQGLITLAAALGFVLTKNPLFLLGTAIVLTVPPVLLLRYAKLRTDTLEASLDGFLVVLSDALTTVPNLTGALESLLPNLEPPLKQEIETVVYEVRLGRSIEDALESLSRRLALPGLDAAVGAVLLGKQTGGDLPKILRKIAATVREMARLVGVIRTKTAEGRSQAWVMGSVPPALVLILEWVNPNWLEPMFTDPIGWILLGGAAVIEVVAIVLIRKIMAVDV